LEEDHPSLDGSVKQTGSRSGADNVSQELDLFNLKYQRLMEALRSRMAEVGEQNGDDPDIKVGPIHSNIITSWQAKVCTALHFTANMGAI
jgi:hypothetical protein